MGHGGELMLRLLQQVAVGPLGAPPPCPAPPRPAVWLAQQRCQPLAAGAAPGLGGRAAGSGGGRRGQGLALPAGSAGPCPRQARPSPAPPRLPALLAARCKRSSRRGGWVGGWGWGGGLLAGATGLSPSLLSPAGPLPRVLLLPAAGASSGSGGRAGASGIVTSGTRTRFLVCTWFVLVHTGMYQNVLVDTKHQSTYPYVLSMY